VIRGDVAAVAAVPEPETYVLLVTGLVVLARVAQKRRQRRVV
jgi:energy-converting hydrogenase Eha subunit C